MKHDQHKEAINDKLQRLPANSGVYRFYNARGTLIYIGKAKQLKSRVRSYFQKGADHSPKTQSMVRQIADFDYIITDNEREALILETNLIKEKKPKYNILARDDKRYPWIGISAEKFPRLFITRKPEVKGRKSQQAKRRVKFFGPFVSSGDMYQILKVIKTHFPLRQRKNPLFKNRPCLNYTIGACPGPCQEIITETEYEKTLKQVTLFLKGKTSELEDILTQEMSKASESLNFEMAAKLRDRLEAVKRLAGQQKTFYADPVSQDILAVSADELRCAITLMTVRKGKLLDSKSHLILLTNQATAEETYNDFVTQYYADVDTDDIPDEIIIQHPVEDSDLLEELLSLDRKKSVKFTLPTRGTKKELLELGVTNAQENLEKARLFESDRLRKDPAPALMALQEALDLPEYPERIECYDISHFQGAQTVASMVVFTDGVSDTSQYRRFKIHSAEGEPDDFKSMHEVITRRFKKSAEDVNPKERWPEPDLVIIDGGKGQLSSAVKALKELGIQNQPIISLAKKFEEVYQPKQSRPVLLARDNPALFLLQQLRDEAHRFAITYHRKLRGKKSKKSALDDIPGIGAKSKEKLLQVYGSVKKIKEVDDVELKQVIGLNKTQIKNLKSHLT